MFVFQLLCFQKAGRKAKDYAKLCSKHYIKLIPCQFLGNMTCSFFHLYNSPNLTPYISPLTVLHWRICRPYTATADRTQQLQAVHSNCRPYTAVAGRTQQFPTPVNSGAYTDCINYPGIPNLNITS
jgi:hypothetical protein